MNTYAIIILLALVGEFVLNLVADMLNLRRLTPAIPKEFEDVYDAEVYRKSQEYTRVRTKFGILTSVISLVVTVLFWFLEGFNMIDQLVRSWNLHQIITGLIYVGILVILRSLFSLPFEIFSTFVIEERFGFNKTTLVTFITDRIKGVLLGVVLGGPLLAGIFWFFDAAGSLAWLYAWGFAALVILIVQFVAPTWIMPLFNKFTPLADGELRRAIFAVADRVRFPLRDIYVMDGSKRSTKSNAFFTGFGKNKRIALFDTLIARHTVDELVAVLAHEIGHYKKRHITQGMIISILHIGVIFFLFSLFLNSQGLYDAFFMEEASIYTGLIFCGMLFSPLEFFLGIALQGLSRKNEFEADRFARETVGGSTAMIGALKRLSVDNLSNLTPHPVYVFLHYSHPPLHERIRALQKA